MAYRTSTFFLFFLWRMVFHIDPPWQLRARQQLQLILKKRGVDIPPSNHPLTLYSLRSDVTGNVRAWLRGCIAAHMCNLPWFHIPTTHVMLKKGPTWSRLVFNHFQFLELWSRDPTALRCCCCGLSSHVAGSVSKQFPRMHLGHMNLGDTVWPSRKKWFAESQFVFERWRKRWKLPRSLSLSFNLELYQLWEEHCAVQQDHVSSFRSLQLRLESRQLTQCGFVISPADHHPQQAHIFCPVHYSVLIHRTFGDTSVFQPCVNEAPVILRGILRQSGVLPKVFQRLLIPKGHLPYAYLLPKESKAWQKARPIIAYVSSWSRQLGKFVGIAVLHFLQQLFGDLFPSVTVQSILQSIVKIFSTTSLLDDLELCQQDLSGFFNSVPHARMLEAVEFMILLYCQRFELPLDFKMTLRMQRNSDKLRLFRGQRRAHELHTVVFPLNTLKMAVQFLLSHSYFTVGYSCFRQVQGASMGSHFAPALCGLVAVLQEYFFTSAFQCGLRDSRLWLNLRYVDNRVMLGVEKFQSFQPWNTWCDLAFYEPPIWLEPVSDSQILGCTVSVLQRALTVQLSHDMGCYRSGLSEGTLTGVSAAFRARALLILRQTRPIHLQLPQLQDLCMIGLRTYVPAQLMRDILYRLLCRHGESLVCMFETSCAPINIRAFVRKCLQYVS